MATIITITIIVSSLIGVLGHKPAANSNKLINWMRNENIGCFLFE